MEFLKKITLISLITLLAINAFTQNSQPTIEAFSKSYAFEKDGKYIKAIEAIQQIYNANNYEQNLRLGWLNYQAGKHTESIKFYNIAIEKMPYAIEPKLGFTYPASALEKWDDIIIQYNAILNIDPQNTLANYRLASIYYSRKDYSKAEKNIAKVVNLYPFDYDSILLYAWILLQTGQNGKAKEMFNKALMYYPDSESAKEGLKLIK